MTLAAPFPWFGGKSRVSELVWARFGAVQNYVEPFFGSGAVLLGRPAFTGNETINDLDGYVANFWRAVQAAPEHTARWADWPVSENDLHARHVWLLQQRDGLRPRLEGDPDFYDAKIAGWWVWGIACWIGSGFCSGNGPWWIDDNRQLVHLGDNGQGVNRQLVHLGGGKGVNRQRLGPWPSRLETGQKSSRSDSLVAYFSELSNRLHRVRVCSGDWSRVCGPSVTFKHGLTGVLLDPPYSDTAERLSDLYREDSESVAHDVREWAVEHGANPLMRIALCGYEGEHDMPGWTAVRWKARGGYGSQGDGAGRENAAREVVWFSPHCIGSHQRTLTELFG